MSPFELLSGQAIPYIVYNMQQAELVNTEPRIERQPLHELVAERVRDMIIEGRLAPGDPVNESRLCKELGVSRTPMREAIYTLSVEGLIALRPGRSTIVRKFSEKEVRDMLSVIAELEVMAGRLACAHASDADIAAISETHETMMAFYHDRDRMPYYKLNQQIHSMIVAASGNAPLAEMHDLLQSRMKRFRFVGSSKPEGSVATYDRDFEHEALSGRIGKSDVMGLLSRVDLFDSEAEASLLIVAVEAIFSGEDAAQIFGALFAETVDAITAEGLTLEQALPSVTSNPSRILKLEHKGRLRAGMDADLLLLDRDLRIRRVMSGGAWRVGAREKLSSISD